MSLIVSSKVRLGDMLERITRRANPAELTYFIESLGGARPVEVTGWDYGPLPGEAPGSC